MKRKVWSQTSAILGALLLGFSLFSVVLGSNETALVQLILGALAFVTAVVLSGPGGLGRLFKGRGLYFGAFTTVSALLIVGIVVVGNWVAYHQPQSWDLTRSRVWTLSDDTVKMLDRLNTDVEVLAFYAPAEPDFDAADRLLRRYAERSPHFRLSFVDPSRRPDLRNQYGIEANGARIVLAVGKREARAQTPLEEEVTNALIRVTRGEMRKIYYTQGHGEPELSVDDGNYTVAAKRLGVEGFVLAGLSLAERPEIPSDASAVLVVGPQRPLIESEAAVLQRYLDRGGRLGVFEEVTRSAGLDALVAAYGVGFDDDIVVVDREHAPDHGSAASITVKTVPNHDITRGMGNVDLIVSTARSLYVVEGAPVQATPMAFSGPSSWGLTDIETLRRTRDPVQKEGEKSGPLPIAMATEKPASGGKHSRVVVVGDAGFFSDSLAKLVYNTDFFLNSVNWLTEQTDRITIRARSREASNVFIGIAQAKALTIISADIVPLILASLGLAIWVHRQSK